MELYLIKDCFRIEGLSGKPVEAEFMDDFIRYDQRLELTVGRNEYASLQLVADTVGAGLDALELSFSDAVGPDGSTIAKEEFTAYIEWFHLIGGKLIPDALVPWGKTNLKFQVPLDREYHAGQTAGAVWIDVFIPKQALPGKYAATITAKGGGVERAFELALTVKSHILCDESRAYADMNGYADSLTRGFAHLRENPDRMTDGSAFAVEHEVYRLCHENRCVFHYLGYRHTGRVVDGFAPEIEGEGKELRVSSWESFDRHFGPLLDGSVLADTKRGAMPIPFLYLPFNFGWPADPQKWDKKGYATEFRRVLIDFMRHFEEKGWNDTWLEIFFNHKKRYRFFPYDGDETRFLEDEEIFRRFDAICTDLIKDTKSRFIFRVDSSWNYHLHYDSRFSDMIKMWVSWGPGIFWFPESVKLMKEKDNILFVYGGMNKMDDTLTWTAWWALRCVMQGIQGVTMWNSVDMTGDPLKTPQDNGGVTAFYPGERFGYNLPVPSIKLKAFRNSMQMADRALMMLGQPQYKRITENVNRIMDVGWDYWWHERPEFLGTPADTWENENFTQIKPNTICQTQSPLLTERLCHMILEEGEGQEHV